MCGCPYHLCKHEVKVDSRKTPRSFPRTYFNFASEIAGAAGWTGPPPRPTDYEEELRFGAEEVVDSVLLQWGDASLLG